MDAAIHERSDRSQFVFPLSLIVIAAAIVALLVHRIGPPPSGETPTILPFAG
ncbi:MAG: hypothetical protein HYV09_13355 [Deltaproteobacteria bacterium]|nr:hypothetical protein [Deltaproteobacteria bacterium]